MCCIVLIHFWTFLMKVLENPGNFSGGSSMFEVG